MLRGYFFLNRDLIHKTHPYSRFYNHYKTPPKQKGGERILLEWEKLRYDRTSLDLEISPFSLPLKDSTKESFTRGFYLTNLVIKLLNLEKYFMPIYGPNLRA